MLQRVHFQAKVRHFRVLNPQSFWTLCLLVLGHIGGIKDTPESPAENGLSYKNSGCYCMYQRSRTELLTDYNTLQSLLAANCKKCIERSEVIFR